MKTEKGEIVRVQAGRRVILPIAFCEKKGIKENDLILIEPVKKVGLTFIKVVDEAVKEKEGEKKQEEGEG